MPYLSRRGRRLVTNPQGVDEPGENGCGELHIITVRVPKRPAEGWRCRACGQEWDELPPLDGRRGCPRVAA